MALKNIFGNTIDLTIALTQFLEKEFTWQLPWRQLLVAKLSWQLLWQFFLEKWLTWQLPWLKYISHAHAYFSPFPLFRLHPGSLDYYVKAQAASDHSGGSSTPAANILIHTQHCTLHTAHCTLNTPHFTLYSAYCTLQTKPRTQKLTLHNEPYTLHCTLHTEH